MGRTVVDEEEERFDAGFSGGAKHICMRADSISENAVEQTMLLNDGDSETKCYYKLKESTDHFIVTNTEQCPRSSRLSLTHIS